MPDTAATPHRRPRRATPPPSAAPTPSGPAGPATAGQLRDGITLEQASARLEKCLAYDRATAPARVGGGTGPGHADGYRIILALNSTGDSNSPGDGMFVVAVQEKAEQIRLICNIKDGEASGPEHQSVGSERQPDARPCWST